MIVHDSIWTSWRDIILKANVSTDQIMIRLSVSLGGVCTVILQVPTICPLRRHYVVKLVLGFSSVRTPESVQYSASGYSMVCSEEDEFFVCWVD